MAIGMLIGSLLGSGSENWKIDPELADFRPCCYDARSRLWGIV
jgi:hypothetical protein